MSTGSAGARRAAILAVAMVGVLGITAAPAVAAKKGAGKFTTAEATDTAGGAFTIATATATCPGKSSVVAGGYETTVPSVGSHWLNVYESQRVGARQWRVSGVQHFAASDTLIAYAYCEAGLGKLKARSASVAMPTTAGGSTVIQAGCPKGTKAISGGFATEAATATDSSLVSRAIAAGGNRWVVDATRLAGTAARSLVAHTYCANIKVKKLFEDAAVVGPLGSQHTAATPLCAKKTSARGGGFATSTPVGGLLNSALVYENLRAGRSWRASATPSSATTSITLVTDAYCR